LRAGQRQLAILHFHEQERQAGPSERPAGEGV